MAECLNIRKLPAYDDSITRKQFHTYSPYNSAFKYNDEVRISIQQQDLYVLPHESYIYVELTVKRKNGVVIPAPADPAVPGAPPPMEEPRFISDYAPFLFEQIRYEINGFEIDSCRNVGITNLMKGYATFDVATMKRHYIETWNSNPDVANLGKYSFSIQLKSIFGFAEDYKKIIMNMKHELILVRSRNDLNCFFGNHDISEIEIDKIQWKIPHVEVSDKMKLMLTKHLEHKRPVEMAFRSWTLHEYPILPNTNKHTWAVKTTNSINRPRYVIVAFQTDRLNQINKNCAGFDHCNVSDLRVYLNGETYPYNALNLDFDNNMYLEAYRMFLDFPDDYYNNHLYYDPFLTYTDFKSCTLFIFDCSRQNEQIKTSMIDVRVEIQTRRNIPANTTAYCLIIHDNIVAYNPYTNIVQRNV